MSYKDVPKVDLHVHLEGTIMPEMALKLAARNNLSAPDVRFNADKTGYTWPDDGTPRGNLIGLVNAVDATTSVIRTPQDYEDITYDYLMKAAAEKCIYVEFTIAPDLARLAGMTYADMLSGIEKGYERARAETGIEMRLISTLVRHFGPAAATVAAETTRDNPHPLVTGIGMAGDENAHKVEDFRAAYDLMGLSYRTAHAGEAAGPESVRAAKDLLGVRRFGHMVRAPEDESLMNELRQARAVPEVCVSSNLCLKVFPDYKSHSLRRMFEAGMKVTLGSDDPPFFNTTIGNEYRIAQEEFGFTDAELLQISRNAIEEAFVDESTRHKLLARLSPRP